MATEWYYSRGDERSGPCSLDELRRLASTGALGRGDLVWNESMVGWSPAGMVPTLFPTPVVRKSSLPEVGAGPEGDHDDPDGLGDSRSDPLPDGILRALDLKFQRPYTLRVVQFLWAAFLILSVIALLLGFLALFIPNTVAGLLIDIASIFTAPLSQATESGPHFSRRLGFFLGMAVFLGVLGLNLRIYLENVSVRFQIVELLREMRKAQADATAARVRP